MRSTGPVVAAGAITLANQVVLNEAPMNWRIPVMTGIAAGAMALLEHLVPELAVGLSWIALITVLFARVDKDTPAPVESLLEWTK